MKECVLYIHGRGGSAAEREHYIPLFPGREVIGLDYRSAVPWEAETEFRAAVAQLKKEYARITLVANSIGAYFAMCAGLDGFVTKAYFIFPIVDMEGVIRNLMRLAGVTEEALKAKKVIPTAFGEDLLWDYLCYARSHPVRWNAPAAVLYGANDNFTSYETVFAFANACGAGLTVMENGEHWFHTPLQTAFLDDWIRRNENQP